MSDVITQPAMITAIVLPLLLMALMIPQRTRPLAASLIPVAPLPTLLLVITNANVEYTLPGFMLGGTFIVDNIGRLFLLLGAALFSAAAFVRRGESSGQQRTMFDVLFLLFIAAMIITILAGDALTYFAAVTVAGYALYGLITSLRVSANDQVGKVLVVLLVISDIAIFELLLLVGEYSTGYTFSALQAGLLQSQGDMTILALMLIGFGIKAAVVGLHFWLAPAMVDAARPVRLLIIGFVFCAGLLAWLRILPLGVALWPVSGELLQWLGGLMVAYATITGLLQTHYRAVLAHTVMVLVAMWLMVGGWLLAKPELLGLLQTHWYFILLQSVFAIGALSLNAPWRLFSAVGLVAALAVSMTPLKLIGAIAPSYDSNYLTLLGIGVALAVLVFKAWRLQWEQHEKKTYRNTQYLAALVLDAAALISTLLGWHHITGVAQAAGFIAALTAAALAGWYGGRARRWLKIPPGDMVQLLRPLLIYLLRLGERLGNIGLPSYTQRLAALCQDRSDPAIWSQRLRTLEVMLSRWLVGIFLMIIIGLAIAIASLATG
jgi:hydrogenase-4 component B